MIIPISEVQAMRQQYATIRHSAYNTRGYLGTEPMLRIEAHQLFAETFAPYTISADDITVTCITMEGEPGNVILVYRASWDPQMKEIQLHGGRRDGRIQAVQYPHSTVTFASNVGSSETDRYILSGYDTDSRRFVFRHHQLSKVA